MDRTRIAEDRGAITVVFALTLTAMLLFAAVAVDAGYLFDVRRQLQSAADAGALAGCWEYIKSGDIGAADALARQYVGLNQVRPATNIVIDAVTIDPALGSVQVEVHQDTDNFFARLIAPSTLVNAKARAQRWRLEGGRYLVPWALPIIKHVDRVEVEVVGTGIIADLYPDLSNGLVWENLGIPTPAGPGQYDVLVRIYNGYGVVEKLIDSQGSLNAETPVARLTVPGATPVFTEISMSNDFVAPDGPSPDWPLVTVRTATAQPGVWLEVNKRKYAMTSIGASATVWTYQFTGAEVPFEGDLLRTFPIDVHTGNKDGVDAYLHVRRSTLPVADVEVAPMITSGGSFGMRLRLSDFEPADAVPGQIYTMRVGSSGNEAGNFGELNFSQMTHQSDCPSDTITTSGNNYYAWTAYGYPGSVHVGDLVGLSPGGTGANTMKALQERFANLPTDAWIVNVPIVQKYDQKMGGAYDVIVEMFGAFRIIPDAQGRPADVHGNVAGEFISYVTNPGGYGDDPGSGDDNALYAPRLVNPL